MLLAKSQVIEPCSVRTVGVFESISENRKTIECLVPPDTGRDRAGRFRNAINGTVRQEQSAAGEFGTMNILAPGWCEHVP